MDFTGKNVIVTGGASGIGLATVKGIVLGGGNAIIVDINLELAQKVKEEISENKVYVYKVDLSNPIEIRNVFKTIIEDLEHINILINNAGIVSTVRFEDLNQEEWDKVISVNLTGVYATISAIFEHMARRGQGRIVNISSVAAKRGGGLLGTAAYAASKSGVIGLTKAVAREGVNKGICCNAVCPSLTMTPMILKQSEIRQQRLKESIPMGRGASPDEIANVILFYASDLASFVTGEISYVDGGVTMGG